MSLEQDQGIMPFSLLMLLLTVLQLQLLTHSQGIKRNEPADCKNQNYTRNYDQNFGAAVKLYDGLRANKKFIDSGVSIQSAACILR